MIDRKLIDVRFDTYTYLKLVCDEPGYAMLQMEIRKELDNELIRKMVDAAKHTKDTCTGEDSEVEWPVGQEQKMCEAILDRWLYRNINTD